MLCLTILTHNYQWIFFYAKIYWQSKIGLRWVVVNFLWYLFMINHKCYCLAVKEEGLFILFFFFLFFSVFSSILETWFLFVFIKLVTVQLDYLVFMNCRMLQKKKSKTFNSKIYLTSLFNSMFPDEEEPLPDMSLHDQGIVEHLICTKPLSSR